VSRLLKVSDLIALALEILQTPDPNKTANAVVAAEEVLRGPEPSEHTHDHALLVLLCAAYVHPQSITESIVATLSAVLMNAPIRKDTCRIAKAVLQGLIATPLASSVIDHIAVLLEQRDLSGAATATLMETLEFAATWARAMLHPPKMIRIAECEHLQRYRAPFLRRILEPCVYAAGAALTQQDFERVIRVYQDDPRLPYCLYYISQWMQFQPAVREAAASLVQGGFEWQSEVTRQLSGAGKRLLVVHNIKDGQGDEMIRCVPLICAFLDSNPSLEVTLITRRTYLFSNPRVNVVQIANNELTSCLFHESFDAVIDFFEPDVPELNYDLVLETRIQDYVQQRRPFLFASSLKGYNQFLFQRVELDSHALTDARGLNRQHVPNIYETTCRLIAELGLPLRCGEDPPGAASLIAGTDWPDADAAWRNLNCRNSEARPVALLNPFGGGEKLKGVVEQHLGLIAAEIEALIDDGYFVILIPNGTPWGSASEARLLAGMVSQDRQIHIGIAPDPASKPGELESGIPYADYVMRQFTWFVRFADLIVTVEGWMMHAAWYLGKPYRVFMLTYSHSVEWHPYLRTRRQDTQACYRHRDNVFRDSDPSPLPEQPRRFTLIAALRELGKTGDSGVIEVIRKSLRSQDREIRRAAAEALSSFTGDSIERDLRRLLDDSDCGVRYRAAKALLNLPASTQVSREVLLAHVYIGQPDRDWPSVIKLADKARPAVAVALKDDDPVVQREAGGLLRYLNMTQAIGRRMQLSE